jgi:DHA2 family multidrug resistance protein
LYGALFAIPIFAQNNLHFTAQQTGQLLIPSAIASGVAMIITGKFINVLGPRILITAGSLVTTGVMFSLASINPDTGASDLFWPLVFRGLGSAMMFLPLSIATLGSLPKHEVPAASGFYNLTRQLGGSFGIAPPSWNASRPSAMKPCIAWKRSPAFSSDSAPARTRPSSAPSPPST